MRRPALVAIDMLNDFFAQYEAARKDRLVRSINELVAIMRGHGRPVIWVRQEFDPDLHDAFPEMRAKQISITIKGTSGCEILPGLAVSPTDPVIVKKRYSAFFGTGLDPLLSEIEPDALILVGINTHACIRTAAIDAYQRDWPVVLAEDCIDSYDREHHEISLRYMRDKIASVMTNREIEQALRKAD
jgi:nicotinamidase-related amidase